MSWLTNHQLERAVTRYGNAETKQAFLGAFPIDKLPTDVKTYPILLIVNSQSYNLGGEHWFALFISSHGCGELFDSSAQPVDLRINRWLNRFTRKGWIRNHFIYQSPFSPIFGAYVLYYILNRLQHPSMKEVLMPKVLNHQHVNDKFLQDWYRKLTSQKLYFTHPPLHVFSEKIKRQLYYNVCVFIIRLHNGNDNSSSVYILDTSSIRKHRTKRSDVQTLT